MRCSMYTAGFLGASMAALAVVPSVAQVVTYDNSQAMGYRCEPAPPCSPEPCTQPEPCDAQIDGWALRAGYREIVTCTDRLKVDEGSITGQPVTARETGIGERPVRISTGSTDQVDLKAGARVAFSGKQGIYTVKEDVSIPPDSAEAMKIMPSVVHALEGGEILVLVPATCTAATIGQDVPNPQTMEEVAIQELRNYADAVARQAIKKDAGKTAADAVGNDPTTADDNDNGG